MMPTSRPAVKEPELGTVTSGVRWAELIVEEGQRDFSKVLGSLSLHL
jgi:hypothetical protein